jgi:hypothetical protein
MNDLAGPINVNRMLCSVKSMRLQGVATPLTSRSGLLVSTLHPERT